MMARGATITSACCLLLLAAGCAGYQTVEHPWHSTMEFTEFSSPTEVRLGDRVRVFTADPRTIEGTLTAMRPEGLVIARSDGRPPVELIPHESVDRIEVYRNGADRLGLVMAASVFVYVAAKAVMPDQVFTPDHDAR